MSYSRHCSAAIQRSRSRNHHPYRADRCHTRVGQIVGRQSVMSTEPAANADARVVKVIVTLDAESSKRVHAYTNLEVIGRIRTKAE